MLLLQHREGQIQFHWFLLVLPLPIGCDWLQPLVAGGIHMRIAAMCCSSCFLVSCASIPDVEYTYYPSKLHGVATVTETVTCQPDGQNIVISSSAAFIPTYAADIHAGLRRIRIRSFEGSFASFADSDANFTFYDDGRLKSINQTTTGQGETIIKSLVSLGTSFSSLVAANLNAKIKTPCDFVKEWAGTSNSDSPPPDASQQTSFETNTRITPVAALGQAPKEPQPTPKPNVGTSQSKGLPSVTLTYTAELDASSTDRLKRSYKFAATGASQVLHEKLSKLLPTYLLTIGEPIEASRPGSFPANQVGPYVNLELQAVAVVDLAITTNTQSQPIFRSNVFVPSRESYFLPIPAAALFGTQKVGLTLAESGLVTQIDYGKNTGLAGAANAANTIVQAVTPESASAKASDIKAQADVLAQQARLHRCLANPAACQ